jgi:hypothetical protein
MFYPSKPKNNYEGNEIPYRVDEEGEVFMNATEMARPFGRSKRVGNFLRNKNVIEYIEALQKGIADIQIRTSADYKVVIIPKKGGNDKNDQGTWFQRNLALEFARWLNPKFNVWCNKQIDEIITKGFSALTEEATEYIEDEIGEVFPLHFIRFDYSCLSNQNTS